MERAGVLGSELAAVSDVEKSVTVAVSPESWRVWLWRVREPAEEGREYVVVVIGAWGTGYSH